MRLFHLLSILDPEVRPEECKLHLACWNGTEDPLDKYLAGEFDEWQAWQGKRNFERPFVVSLIQLATSHQWLFAGVHDSLDADWVEERDLFHYRMRRREGPNEVDGRLVVEFERPGRQAYLLSERWTDALRVVQISAKKLQIVDFAGYSSARLSKQHLDLVVQQNIDSWRSALANVAGVYVIGDRQTGRLYVGSASGEEGIWSRWCAHSETGHGGNKELEELLQREGPEYANNFQFGVLEIAGAETGTDDVLKRESYWKGLLLSRAPHGCHATQGAHEQRSEGEIHGPGTPA